MGIKFRRLKTSQMRALPNVCMKSPKVHVNAQKFTLGGGLGDVSVQHQCFSACATSPRQIHNVATGNPERATSSDPQIVIVIFLCVNKTD